MHRRWVPDSERGSVCGAPEWGPLLFPFFPSRPHMQSPGSTGSTFQGHEQAWAWGQPPLEGRRRDRLQPPAAPSGLSTQHPWSGSLRAKNPPSGHGRGVMWGGSSAATSSQQTVPTPGARGIQSLGAGETNGHRPQGQLGTTGPGGRVSFPALLTNAASKPDINYSP